MGNKQQLNGSEGLLNPENFIHHLNIKGNQSFDTKGDNQNTTVSGLNTTGGYDSTANITHNNSERSLTKNNSPRSKRKKKQIKLSEHPNMRQTQIFNAKRQYQRKRLQNQSKLLQIRQRRQTYNQIYFDDDDDDNNKTGDAVKDKKQIQQNSVTIWGKKVNLNQNTTMKTYYQYRYPKQYEEKQQQQQNTNEYTNWGLYKKQMSKTKFKQLQDEQDKLLKEEEELRLVYESLVRQKNQLKVVENKFENGNYNKNIKNKSSLSIDIQKNLSSQHYEESSRQSSNHQKIVTPSFQTAQKINFIISQNDKKQSFSPLTTIISNRNDNNKQQGKQSHNETIQSQLTNQNDNKKIQLFQVNNNTNTQIIDQWVHPQNIISSDPDYKAKQIYFYENYLMKKKSSYVPLSALSLMEQYPAKKQRQIIKPIRNKRTVVDPYLQKLQKSKIKKSNRLKTKSKSKSRVKKDESMYTKVYEKVPKRKQSSSFHSPEHGRFQNAVNFYPWEDSNQRKRRKADEYPSQMIVNDSLHKSDQQNGELYFHFISRQNEDKQQWRLHKNIQHQIPDGGDDEPDEKTLALKYAKCQRMVESQILQKVRLKNL